MSHRLAGSPSTVHRCTASCTASWIRTTHTIKKKRRATVNARSLIDTLTHNNNQACWNKGRHSEYSFLTKVKIWTFSWLHLLQHLSLSAGAYSTAVWASNFMCSADSWKGSCCLGLWVLQLLLLVSLGALQTPPDFSKVAGWVCGDGRGQLAQVRTPRGKYLHTARPGSALDRFEWRSHLCWEYSWFQQQRLWWKKRPDPLIK